MYSYSTNFMKWPIPVMIFKYYDIHSYAYDRRLTTSTRLDYHHHVRLDQCRGTSHVLQTSHRSHSMYVCLICSLRVLFCWVYSMVPVLYYVHYCLNNSYCTLLCSSSLKGQSSKNWKHKNRT